jgi:hypothetical protein
MAITANLVFNTALGRIAYLATLPGASDSIIAVPLELTGLVDDSVMRDYADLATLLAGASNEQTTMGRLTAANVSTAVDNTNDRVGADCDDLTWTAATGNAVAAVVMCYVPSSGASDSAIIPMTKHYWPMTPDSSDLVAPVADFWRSVSAA